IERANADRRRQLAIDDAGARAQACQCLDDEREARTFLCRSQEPCFSAATLSWRAFAAKGTDPRAPELLRVDVKRFGHRIKWTRFSVHTGQNCTPNYRRPCSLAEYFVSANP